MPRARRRRRHRRSSSDERPKSASRAYVSPSFNNSVFINCPFDREYEPLFRAIVFTIYDCGFAPRCALEESDSGDVRLLKIVRLLRGCRYSVHDISRKTARFNMPLELGLELGLRHSGHPLFRSKRSLVLDSQAHEYQKVLSDLAGCDAEPHDDAPEQAIRRIRDWLRTTSRRADLPGGAMIAQRYSRFAETLPALAAEAKLATEEMVYLDYAGLVEDWLALNAPAGSPVTAGTS